jgi:hypothetical protein
VICPRCSYIGDPLLCGCHAELIYLVSGKEVDRDEDLMEARRILDDLVRIGNARLRAAHETLVKP